MEYKWHETAALKKTQIGAPRSKSKCSVERKIRKETEDVMLEGMESIRLGAHIIGTENRK